MKYALERGDAFRSKYDIRDISNLGRAVLVWLKGYAKSLHKTAQPSIVTSLGRHFCRFAFLGKKLERSFLNPHSFHFNATFQPANHSQLGFYERSETKRSETFH